MKVMVVTDKWSTSYYQADTPEKLKAAADGLLKERISDGYWYLDEDAEDAQEALDQDRSWNYLQSRSGYEYEDVALVDVREFDQ